MIEVTSFLQIFQISLRQSFPMCNRVVPLYQVTVVPLTVSTPPSVWSDRRLLRPLGYLTLLLTERSPFFFPTRVTQFVLHSFQRAGHLDSFSTRRHLTIGGFFIFLLTPRGPLSSDLLWQSPLGVTFFSSLLDPSRGFENPVSFQQRESLGSLLPFILPPRSTSGTFPILSSRPVTLIVTTTPLPHAEGTQFGSFPPQFFPVVRTCLARATGGRGTTPLGGSPPRAEQFP